MAFDLSVYVTTHTRDVTDPDELLQRFCPPDGPFTTLIISTDGRTRDPKFHVWLNEVIRLGFPLGIGVQARFSPCAYNRETLKGNPEWAAVPKPDGIRSLEDLCLTSAAARRYQIASVAMLLRACPRCSGVVVEEPHLRNEADYCPACMAFYPNVSPHDHDDMHAERRRRKLRAAVSTDFIEGLAGLGKGVTVNGSYDINTDAPKGANWAEWLSSDTIVGYQPEVYTRDVREFSDWLWDTIEAVNWDRPRVMPIIGGEWSKTERPPAGYWAKRIGQAHEIGCRGVAVIPAMHLTDADLAAIRGAMGG